MIKSDRMHSKVLFISHKSFAHFYCLGAILYPLPLNIRHCQTVIINMKICNINTKTCLFKSELLLVHDVLLFKLTVKVIQTFPSLSLNVQWKEGVGRLATLRTQISTQTDTLLVN
jgi:hypothetical protein